MGQDDKKARIGISDITWEQSPYIMGSGACMGTADVVPGVSGGTMAVALGIYPRLLAAIASVNMHSIKALARLRLRDAFQTLHWRFLVSLGAGIAIAIVVMLKVVNLPRLLEVYPRHVYAVFFGLVFASAIVLGRRLERWTIPRGSLVLVGAAVGFAIVNLVPVDTPTSTPFIFLCGMVAICAMLLPGISGSFVLLILGKYEYVIDSLSKLLHLDLAQLAIVVPFALGCLTGLASFARFLGWLLARWHDTVLVFLIGLLIGSLWRIWPYQDLQTIIVREKPRVISAEPFWPASMDVSVMLLMLLGLFAVLGIEYVAYKRSGPQPV